MALFPDPPELPIGYPERPSADPGGFTGLNSSHQLFTSGSNVYMTSIALRDSNNSGGQYAIIGKRTSGTWGIPDVAGFQNLVDLTNYFWLNSCACQQGNLLHMFGTTPAPFFLIHITFDTSTDLYSATTENPYQTGLGTTSQPAGLPICAALSNGDVIIAWGGGNTSTTSAHFAFISSGVFGSAQTLVAASAGHFLVMRSMMVDASDTTHIFYEDRVGATHNLRHISVTSGGSVSASDLVEGTPAFDYTFGPGCLFNSLVTFTGCKAFDANIYLFESDPTTISWTKKTVAARTNDTSGNIHPCPAVVTATDLYIAWPENDPTPYPAQTATVQYSIYDGSSFTAKAVAWDAGTNQYPGAGISPAGDIDVQFPNLQFSGGTLRLLGYSEFDPSYDETELYLETVLFPPTSTQMNRFSTTSSYAGIVMP